MEKTKIMINGLPGNVASNLLTHFNDHENFELIKFSLTGEDTQEKNINFNGKIFELLKPSQRGGKIGELIQKNPGLIAVDYTHPSAVNDNTAFYVSNKIPFVMGTTGGDREKIVKDVEKSEISAVIAPNMAKQIVGFQAMMEFTALNFPDLFKGYTLEINESHQTGKADTSGTAKAMVNYFNKLGLNFDVSMIKKERDQKNQIDKWKIPQEYISGHAWHTYTLKSEDGNVKFEFTHNINGRNIYSKGTLDAVSFLEKKIKQGIKGRVFSMIDVLKG